MLVVNLMQMRLLFCIWFIIYLLISPLSLCVVCRNVLSSQEVVDFISERIKPDESGNVRSLSSIVEEVREMH